MNTVKKIFLATFVILLLIVTGIIIFLVSKINLLTNLGDVYLLQTRDKKIEVYSIDKPMLFSEPDLDESRLIKTVKLKPVTVLVGNKNDNYIDARGISSSKLYIYGVSGDDVLVGGLLDDYIRGGAGTDLMIGCYGGDNLASGDDFEVLIGGDLSDEDDGKSFDSIKNGCELEGLESALIERTQINEMESTKPWYYDLALAIYKKTVDKTKEEPQASGVGRSFSYQSNLANDPVLAERNKQLFQQKLKEATAGDGFSQYNLATMYFRAVGTKLDIEQGFYWMKKAAENNQILAQRDLAIHYARSADANYQESYYWTLVGLKNKLFSEANLQAQPMLKAEQSLLLSLKTGLEKEISPSDIELIKNRVDDFYAAN